MDNQIQSQVSSIEDWSKLEPVNDPSLIILLDLNHTLVSGSRDTLMLPGKNYGEKILNENYRLGLVELDQRAYSFALHRPQGKAQRRHPGKHRQKVLWLAATRSVL